MYKLISTMLFILFTVLSVKAVAVESDYLVLSWTEQDGLVAEYHTVVDLAADFKNKSSTHSSDNIKLLAADGSLIDEVSVQNARYTRSEHHGHDHIDGQLFVNEQITFVVRAPRGQVKQLSLPEQLDKSQSLINYSNLIKQAKQKGPQTLKQSGGAADNRINLLIMGDGYTQAQQNSFNADVNSVIAYMQTFEPYQSYSNFISYDQLFTASNQSGADKPAACFGGSAVTVDTAFDGSYCISNIQRLLTVSSSKIYTAAAASPSWNEIIVIVNDDEYGGSGGAFSTFSTHASANDIFIHEYGHSFTGLADEYDTPYPGYPACSDINGPSCQVNVTDVTVRNNIKWNYFIDPLTPVPTPETGAYDNVIGLFEGARYLATGMYRPKNQCNMKVLAADFCAVCQEAYVFKVYTAPYANGSVLSLLEPGTAQPANLTPSGMVSTPMSFSVDTLQPSHDINVVWLLNGTTQVSSYNSQTTQSFQFTPVQTGNNTVTVRVKDNSPLVDNSRHSQLPQFELSWQVNVLPLVDLIFADGFE